MSLPASARTGVARRTARPSRPSSRLERSLRAQGLVRIAGVDEVGRGSLFGPVVAAAVILDPAKPIRGLQDSKQLSAERRGALCSRIRERALAVSVAAVDSGRIDLWNIYQATRLAMRQAVLALNPRPDGLLIDAMKLDLEIPQRSVIRGDARSFSIAAASIVAKTERDRWIELWDGVFPHYGLASNKGYATPAHLRALERFGPAPLHRYSFEPVACHARFPATLPLACEQLELPLPSSTAAREIAEPWRLESR